MSWRFHCRVWPKTPLPSTACCTISRRPAAAQARTFSSSSAAAAPPKRSCSSAWPEHRLQLSAYARAYNDMIAETPAIDCRKISVGNVYLSSVRMGEFVICEHDDWWETFEKGFYPLLSYWQFVNNFAPVQ